MESNIFDYLQEESNLIEGKFTDLLLKLTEKSREEVFDDVKLICDELRGYCRKEESLLLEKIPERGEYAQELRDTLKAKDALLLDLDDLVMVHVDEPGYQDYMQGLLMRARAYFDASQRLYKKLREALPVAELNKIDAHLTDVIHSDVGYNALQGAK